MRLEGLLAGVEGEEEEDDEDRTEDGEDHHAHHHVHRVEGLRLVCGVVREGVGHVHEIAQRPAE